MDKIRLPLEKFTGLTVNEAQELAAAYGYTIQVETPIMTYEYNSARVTLDVKESKVVEAWVG